MSNSIVLTADPSRLASLPAPVLGSHPLRVLPSGPRRRLAIRGASTAIIDQLTHSRSLRADHGLRSNGHSDAVFCVEVNRAVLNRWVQVWGAERRRDHTH